MAGTNALLLFGLICLALMAGYPVAFTLAGVSLLFAAVASITGAFDPSFLAALPSRLYGVMTNQTLLAVPLFVFMGVMLERSNIARELMQRLGDIFGKRPGGLGFAVLGVGTLMAASTGIVGATVVTMGLMALPAMLQRGYDPRIAAGTVAASGTLGQIIPPSIVLVLLGDVLSNAFSQAQMSLGVFSPETVSVGDLFLGALIPGVLLVALYACYLAWIAPTRMPAPGHAGKSTNAWRTFQVLIAPLLLMVLVLGSIIAGIATPTEAAAVGAVGAMLLAALRGECRLGAMGDVMRRTVLVTSMVFMILIGASVFALVFRGLGGDEAVHALLTQLPGGQVGALIAVMALMFVLGFVLDFIEITFVVVPIVGPVLLAMGIDPVWLGVLIAINLQTSFLTPPFGFALFYLRGVAPDNLKTVAIYRGVLPFIACQLIMMALLAAWPALATWLPDLVLP